MAKYVILQFIQLVLIVILKLYFPSNESVLDLLTLTPILLSAFFVINYHKNINEDSKMLIYSILAAILGDIFLIYLNPSLGISFFFIAQAFYYSYLSNGKDIKYLIIFCIANSLFCYYYKELALKPEAFLYALITIFNIIKSIKLIIRNKIKVAYFTSFIFLMICDLALFLQFFFAEYNINLINDEILYVIQWICYIMFQTLLATSLINYTDARVIDFLEKVVEPYQIEEDILNDDDGHKKLL